MLLLTAVIVLVRLVHRRQLVVHLHTLRRRVAHAFDLSVVVLHLYFF